MLGSELVLGGRKVQIRRPRVRANGEEVAPPTFDAFADTDPLNRRVVEQMLVGVATRLALLKTPSARSELHVHAIGAAVIVRKANAAELDACEDHGESVVRRGALERDLAAYGEMDVLDRTLRSPFLLTG